MQSTSSAHSVHLVKSYLGHVELKKIRITFKYRGFMFTYTHTCTHSTAGLGNTVKSLTIVLKPVHNKTCYMAKKNNLDPSDLILIISTDYLTLMHLPSLREEPCSSKGILNGQCCEYWLTDPEKHRGREKTVLYW